MKHMKKIVLTAATMIMALCLMAVGVFAALTQSVDINGKITVNINQSENAVMAVAAYIKGGQIEDYTLYGSKPSWTNQITFVADDIILDEDNFYLIHKLEFTNYGAAISSFNLSVIGNDDDAGTQFRDNFDYYIGLNENPTSKNTALTATDFMEEGTAAPVLKTVYVRIQLKDDPSDPSGLTAKYSIAISYFVNP